MNSHVNNQTGGGPTPWPRRYFNADPAAMKSGCGCAQTGGSPTPLPQRWFNPTDQQAMSSPCGCGQAGGSHSAMGDCLSSHPDFTDMLYRGSCARQRASGACQYGVSNLQCLPAMYPIPHQAGEAKSAFDLMTQQRLVQAQPAAPTPAGAGVGVGAGEGEGEQSGGGCGGGAFGAPFSSQSFGCAAKAPGVPGLSYRFNECGLETGVNFYRV